MIDNPNTLDPIEGDSSAIPRYSAPKLADANLSLSHSYHLVVLLVLLV